MSSFPTMRPIPLYLFVCFEASLAIAFKRASLTLAWNTHEQHMLCLQTFFSRTNNVCLTRRCGARFSKHLRKGNLAKNLFNCISGVKMGGGRCLRH